MPRCFDAFLHDYLRLIDFLILMPIDAICLLFDVSCRCVFDY